MQCSPRTNPVFLTNLPSPFTKGITLHFGRLFTIKGTTPSVPRRFSFNFLVSGKHEESAFHMDVRYDEGSVVRNSRIAGTWLAEERSGAFPVQRNQDFEMMVLVEESRFMIAFNGAHFTEFVHRVPASLIDTVFIGGDIHITSYQESMGFAGSMPGKPLSSEKENCFEYNVGSCLIPGGKINIGGLPTGNTFIIDLKPEEGSEDIGLHMSCRVANGVVVLNSRIGNAWQEEVRPTNWAFAKGSYFHLGIGCVNGKELALTLNGCSVATFPIRHVPALNLKRLSIHGDVKVGFVTL